MRWPKRIIISLDPFGNPHIEYVRNETWNRVYVLAPVKRRKRQAKR